MLYMIIESFKNRDEVPVYRRFRDHGRLAPEGVKYISSWVTLDMSRCYQLMECEDRHLLDQWIARWSDLVDFEVLPVITSAQAVERIAPKL
jgi:tRNA splicing endonuclease